VERHEVKSGSATRPLARCAAWRLRAARSALALRPDLLTPGRGELKRSVAKLKRMTAAGRSPP
jgi:hypothetical protein